MSDLEIFKETVLTAIENAVEQGVPPEKINEVLLSLLGDNNGNS